ncbi:dienelactone hydrolase family protein [Saitoella complicata NRRL Y-17804]|nr:dienelactone hydrolase family protein [Saitoella complicata NRRL Y-17804]ODQ56246.1 dienelactone hydrolase family protein [Saitoella complicata NRRL Y-17804]
MSSGMCPQCVSGFLHEGTPSGSIVKIGGIDAYVATPKDDNSKSKTIVLLPDVFGWELNNARLLADDYARAGFYAVLPDILNGDSLPADYLDSAKSTEDVYRLVGPWLQKHGDAVTEAPIDAVLAALHADSNVGKIGAVGFCFGGLYALKYAATDKISAAVAAHPSRIQVPDHILPIRQPISFAVARTDVIYDETKAKEADEVLKKNGVEHETKIYDGEGVGHGFAVRGDLSVESLRKAKEEATVQTLAWFKKHLA